MKTILIIKSIFLMIVTVLLCRCVDRNENENCHKHVTIINNSNLPIYYGRSGRYPDTITLYPDPTGDQNFKIEAYSVGEDRKYRDCLEKDFESQRTWMYFIFDSHLLETTPWDTVVKKYMILKRYDLTLEDMVKSDWTITYP
jgi:hypothetical protein